MWVQAHQQSVPDRSSRAALPASSPRQTGPVLNGGDPPASAPLQPTARLRTSVLVSKGGSFLLFDDPPAAAPANPRDSISSTGTGPFFLDFNAPYLSGAPAAPEPATTPTTTAAKDQRNDTRQQPWPPPRKESLSDNNPTPWVR
jgi:hypothetical protein